MISRAREITEMMGYGSVDETLEAIGRGELMLLKVPESQRSSVSNWIRDQVPEVRGKDEELAKVLDDMADTLDLALELTRYPADADVCELDLPHGWPSYCDKEAIR
ncbi:MAG: hypothetical protein ACP5JG_14030 [Anaerolineae bacterium]